MVGQTIYYDAAGNAYQETNEPVPVKSVFSWQSVGMALLAGVIGGMIVHKLASGKSKASELLNGGLDL